MATTVPARDGPGPQQQLLNVWRSQWLRGFSPRDSLQEHQLRPGPSKALLHCLHVLGGPDHPQNPATCDPLLSTSAVPSLCPGGTAGGLFLGAKTSDPTHTPDETPALPSDVLLPWQPALCTCSSPAQSR